MEKIRLNNFFLSTTKWPKQIQKGPISHRVLRQRASLAVIRVRLRSVTIYSTRATAKFRIFVTPKCFPSTKAVTN